MDTKYNPAYLLRAYVWQVLKNNTSMDESDYGGLVPIVPVAEEPELSEFSSPYIVYGYAISPVHDLYARKTGSMTFAIYSPDFQELTKILNVLTAALERRDESARDINEYTTSIPQFVGIRFGYVEVGFVEGGTPEETEGGRQSGLINVRFEYYVDYNVKTRLADFTV